ncbi:MAG TPA: hypothetical protein VEK08_11270 [Planctomycetota bacterium]|nr:hypothetical protein [Planctomycetota bacterium]
MHKSVWMPTLALALMALCLSGDVRAGEKEGGGKRGGGALAPEMIEKTLSGELALSAEQKTAVTEAYTKTIKPVREKMQAAGDKDARKALAPEMKTAYESYQAELKKILKEPQMAKLTEAQEAMKKQRGEGKGPDGKGDK